MIYLVFFRKIFFQVFGPIKLHKNRSKNFFLLKKVIRLRGQFCSTELVIDTFYVKYYSVLTQYYKIDLLIEKTLLSKKNIYF